MRTDQSTTNMEESVLRELGSDPERFADRMQTDFALSKANAIFAMMTRFGTTVEALALFDESWPQINKAWARVCDSEQAEDMGLRVAFLRRTAPMLIATGEREILRLRVGAAIEATERLNDVSATRSVVYFRALVHAQDRAYELALPLLEDVCRTHLENASNPTVTEAMTALGAIYVCLGREEMAEPLFEEVSKHIFLSHLHLQTLDVDVSGLYADAFARLMSGTGLKSIFARPPRSMSAGAPHGPASFFQHE